MKNTLSFQLNYQNKTIELLSLNILTESSFEIYLRMFIESIFKLLLKIV